MWERRYDGIMEKSGGEEIRIGARYHKYPYCYKGSCLSNIFERVTLFQSIKNIAKDVYSLLHINQCHVVYTSWCSGHYWFS